MTSTLSGKVQVSTPGAPAIRVETAHSGTVAVSPGMVGPQGGGVRLNGAVPSYEDLPTGLGVEDAGAAWVTQDDGLLYVWSGTAWPHEGTGSQFRGDKGDRGTGVESVSVAGSDLSFGLSDGTSRLVTVPALVNASSAAADAVGAADRAVSARTGAESARDVAVVAAGRAEGAAAGVAADAVAAGDAAGRAEVAADSADASAAAAAADAAAVGGAREFVSWVHADLSPGGATTALFEGLASSASSAASQAGAARDAAAASAAEAQGHADRAESAADGVDQAVSNAADVLDQASVFAQDQVPPYLQQSVLNDTYARTEPRHVNVFHHGVSPENSGAVNHAAFQAAIDAAPDGSTIVMPSTGPDARVHIDDKIVPRPGMTVSGLGGRGYIAQDTWGMPVFDLPRGEVNIERWDALSTPEKSVLPGSYRDGSAINGAVVVWLGGHRARLSDVIGRGFTSVCRSTPWDETTQALGDTSDGHIFEKIGVDGCDWGVVGAGFREATFRDFYGTYNTREGSSDPGHIIYIAPQKRSYDVTITDCTTVNGTGGRAFSLKNIDGLSASGLSSRGCEGFLDYTALVNARLSNLRGLDDRATTDGVVYGFGGSDNENITVNGALLEPHPDAQAVRADGLNGVWSDISVLASRESFYDGYDITVYGEGNTLIRPSVINRTGFAWRFIGLNGSGGRHRVISPTTRGTRAGISVPSTVPGCVLEYSPALLDINRAGTYSATVSNQNPSTVFNIAPTVIRVETAGGNIRGNSSEYSVMQVVVTGAGSVSIQSPYDRPNGHEITHEITNATASEMGAISFTGTHVTSGTFPSPGPGKTSTISFRYDGVDNVWRETRRFVAT